jgi:hypothetical protein
VFSVTSVPHFQQGMGQKQQRQPFQRMGCIKILLLIVGGNPKKQQEPQRN